MQWNSSVRLNMFYGEKVNDQWGICLFERKENTKAPLHQPAVWVTILLCFPLAAVLLMRHLVVWGHAEPGQKYVCVGGRPAISRGDVWSKSRDVVYAEHVFNNEGIQRHRCIRNKALKHDSNMHLSDAFDGLSLS